MFEKPIKWMRGHWWGIIIAYISVLFTVYVLIWTILEPLEVPNTFQDLPEFLKLRTSWHLISTFFVSAYITLILDLVIRRDIIVKLNPVKPLESLGIKELYSGQQDTPIYEIHDRIFSSDFAFFADDQFTTIRISAVRSFMESFLEEGKTIKILIASSSLYQDKLKEFTSQLSSTSKRRIEVRHISKISKRIYGSNSGAYVTFNCEHIVPAETFTVYCVPTASSNGVYKQAFDEFNHSWIHATKL